MWPGAEGAWPASGRGGASAEAEVPRWPETAHRHREPLVSVARRRRLRAAGPEVSGGGGARRGPLRGEEAKEVAG